MRATINGDKRDIADETLAQLLAHLGINLDGTAVAVNDAVVPRNLYETHHLQDGDRIEIIKAVSGG